MNKWYITILFKNGEYGYGVISTDATTSLNVWKKLMYDSSGNFVTYCGILNEDEDGMVMILVSEIVAIEISPNKKRINK